MSRASFFSFDLLAKAKGLFFFYVMDHCRLLYNRLRLSSILDRGSHTCICISSDMHLHISRSGVLPPSPALSRHDQWSFQESMRFICSSFALSVSVISASLLNTRGALSCSRRFNHLPQPGKQGKPAPKSALIKDQSSHVVKPKRICSKWLSY